MKRRKKPDENQLNFLACLREGPPSVGSLNINLRVRHAISEAIRKCGKDRIDICGGIYKLTGLELPKSTLDNWSAESRDRLSEGIDYNGNRRWGMAIDVVPAFCQVTGDFELLTILVEACGYRAMKGRDTARARVGLLREEIAKKNQELKELEKALLETE